MWRAAVGGGLVGVVGLVLVAGTAPPAAAQKAKATGKAKGESHPLNDRVVEFAKKKVGEQVGNGECWTLANDAVLAAGAGRARATATSRPRGTTSGAS